MTLYTSYSTDIFTAVEIEFDRSTASNNIIKQLKLNQGFFCGLSWLPDQLTDTKENLRLKKHTSLNHLQQAGKPRESNIILLHTVLFSFYTESLVNLRRELLFVSFFFPLTHFTPTHLERISNWHTNQLTHDSFSSLTYLCVTAKAHSSKVHVTSCVELSPTIRADQSHALI